MCYRTICLDNTIHQAFDLAVAASPLPWIHIAEPVAMEAERRGFRQLAITGTKYLMASDVYPRMLKRFRIAWMTPDERDRQVIDDIIFNELVKGVVSDASRNRFNSIIAALRKHGCDAVVLGCTELPILAGHSDPCPLPPLDSTRLLARRPCAGQFNTNRKVRVKEGDMIECRKMSWWRSPAARRR